MEQARSLITTAAVARRLGISENRVRQLAQAGRIPVAFTTASGERLYDAGAMERLAAERAQRREAQSR